MGEVSDPTPKSIDRQRADHRPYNDKRIELGHTQNASYPPQRRTKMEA